MSEATLAKSSRWDRYAPNTLALMVSFVAHVSVMLMMACWVLSQAPANVGLDLALQTGSSEEDIELEAFDIQQVAPQVADLPQASAAPENPLNLNVDSQLLADDYALNSTLAGALAAANSGGSGRKIGEGLGEQLTKKGAAFFGAYAEGERFVFVLDSSKSMTGSRWIYACQELMDSVRNLEPHHQFTVICFDVGAKCMFNAPLAKAKYYKNDQATIHRLNRWLTTLPLGPATQPSTALLKALDMHPDAIFLLSDGELQDNTVMNLRAMNGFSSEKRQVPVHAIHLMSMQGRATLQLIARENSGSFTPIQGE